MKYDKSKVYTSLTADELNPGDKVIVADSPRLLRQDVEEGGHISVLKGVLDDSHFRRFKTTVGVEWGLAYLVERKENCTNCGEGKWDAEHKKILCDPVHCGNGNVVFRNQEIEVCEYWKPKTKQKAEHKCETCKYVNCGFKDFNTKNECDRWEAERKAEKHIDYNHCEEARKAYACAMTNACPNKHYRPFKDTDELVKVWMDGGKYDYKEMPLIWVRQKECDKGGLLVTYFGEDEVKTDMGFLTMSKLLSDYTFTDGSPCGVEE